MLNRKYIRIALSQDDNDKFKRAKANAEKETGLVLSDSLFALGVIRKAIK